MLFGAAVLLFAASDAKVDWCHFPPGQWTGDRTTSKYQILNIALAADGSAGPAHSNHAGDGPVSQLGSSCVGGNPCKDTAIGGPGTVSSPCPNPVAGFSILTCTFQLVPGTGANANKCVCPAESSNPGNLPFGPFLFDDGKNYLSCGWQT